MAEAEPHREQQHGRAGADDGSQLRERGSPVDHFLGEAVEGGSDDRYSKQRQGAARSIVGGREANAMRPVNSARRMAAAGPTTPYGSGVSLYALAPAALTGTMRIPDIAVARPTSFATDSSSRCPNLHRAVKSSEESTLESAALLIFPRHHSRGHSELDLVSLRPQTYVGFSRSRIACFWDGAGLVANSVWPRMAA
jgi:hypothetical protein